MFKKTEASSDFITVQHAMAIIDGWVEDGDLDQAGADAIVETLTWLPTVETIEEF